MKVLVVGAGPAGLYAAYLLRRRLSAARIRVVDQNPADSTFGFGVVFSDRALDVLRAGDPETMALLDPHIERWTSLTVVAGASGGAGSGPGSDERVVVDGIGFAAIGRLKLLQILRQQLASVGIEPEHERVIARRDELDGYDLVVGADGMNSFVRRTFAHELGTRAPTLRNKFVWYGTTKPFDTLTQTFLHAPEGTFNAHHYRYSPTMSTFLVEADPDTWERAGFATMDEPATRAYLARIFARALDGNPLVANKSVWRTFPRITNERWSVRVGESGRAVLIGDALHTAHYSIGSGTRLALEDAAALAKAVAEHPGDLAGGLAAFEAERRPAADRLLAAADGSADWYERYPEHMRLRPWDLAWSYIQRSGRIDAAKLAKIAPRFVAGYEASRGAVV